VDQPEKLWRDRGARAFAGIAGKVSFGLVTVGCALAIAACGGSGTPGNATRAGGSAPAVSYAGCMRSHGVPNFPDSSPSGGFHIPSTINPGSPAYVSARQTCAKLLPGPVALTPTSDGERLGLVAAAKCMRTHGVEIADPTFSGPYITLDVPDHTTIQSPAFKRAEQTCHYAVPESPAGATPSP
jgi:hypothetical protein